MRISWLMSSWLYWECQLLKGTDQNFCTALRQQFTRPSSARWCTADLRPTALITSHSCNASRLLEWTSPTLMTNSSTISPENSKLLIPVIATDLIKYIIPTIKTLAFKHIPSSFKLQNESHCSPLTPETSS